MNARELYQMLREGWQAQQDEYAKGDVTGVWRGGNSGCLHKDGYIMGCDPRIAVLRYLGIQMPVDFDTSLMFDAGFANEDSHTALLKAAGIEYRCEEEVPVSWKLSNGTPVTGRPDCIIGSNVPVATGHDGDTVFVGELGIEDKLVCSVHTAMKVAHFALGKPKTENICQAAHYSWQNHYLPWVLRYTSRTNFMITYGDPSKSNPSGYWSDPDHRAIKRTPAGKAYNMWRWVSIYDLTWDGDNLLFEGEDTVITGQGIRDFYEYCESCVVNKTVPTIKSTHDFLGKKIPSDKNDALKYYDFRKAREDQGWDTWIEDCRRIAE